MLYLVLINGLIDSFNHCAVGVLIFYLALLISFKTQRRLLITFGLFYILSIYTTYLLIGLGLLRSFHLFGIHNFFGWTAALLILGVGLYNIKEYFWPYFQIPVISPFLSRCRLPRLTKEVSIISAITLGFLVGLCEFPCSGGIYLATIALLSIKKTFLIGLFYLLLYNLMFVLPLAVIFATSANKSILNRLQKIQSNSSKLLKLIMGIAMLVSGILLIIWLIK